MASSLHISGILASIIKQMKAQDTITIKEIISPLGERAFGILILLFCVPNCLPTPNFIGLSALTGIPVIILGLQMIIGSPYLWLPAKLAEKQFSGRRFAVILERAIPYILKIEVLLHPRLQVMSTEAMKRLLGVMFTLLATIMVLPIPFGNLLPGLAMALMAIGLIERDGITILLGLLIGAATVAVMFTAADAILSALQSFFS